MARRTATTDYSCICIDSPYEHLPHRSHSTIMVLLGKEQETIGTGDPPVPSGDSPDGMGVTIRANGEGLFPRLLSAVPVGGSLTAAGESPALPLLETRS